MKNQELADQIETLTNNNEHTDALITKARAMQNILGDAYATILEEIKNQHELAGYMTEELIEKRNTIASWIAEHDEYLGLKD